MILANGLLNILAVVRKFLCDFEGYFFVVEQLDNLRDQLHKVNACSHVTFAFAQIGAKPLHSHVGFVQQAHKGITLFNDGRYLEAEECLTRAVKLRPAEFKAV